MSGFIKKIIYVAKENEKELKWAAATFAGGALSEPGKDVYKAIRDHLTAKKVPYQEANITPEQIPPGHTYWHS